MTISLSPEKNPLAAMGMVVIGLLVLFGTAPTEAEVPIENFEYGNLALEIWGVKGRAASPLWVQYWIYFIFTMGLTGVFFMRDHIEARWAAGGVLFSISLAVFLIPYTPIIELGGLFAVKHMIIWAPGLYLLLKNRPFINGLSAFSIWSGMITATMLFSLVFDIRDALIYVPYIWSL